MYIFNSKFTCFDLQDLLCTTLHCVSMFFFAHVFKIRLQSLLAKTEKKEERRKRNDDIIGRARIIDEPRKYVYPAGDSLAG